MHRRQPFLIIFFFIFMFPCYQAGLYFAFKTCTDQLYHANIDLTIGCWACVHLQTTPSTNKLPFNNALLYKAATDGLDKFIGNFWHHFNFSKLLKPKVDHSILIVKNPFFLYRRKFQVSVTGNGFHHDEDLLNLWHYCLSDFFGATANDKKILKEVILIEKYRDYHAKNQAVFDYFIKNFYWKYWFVFLYGFSSFGDIQEILALSLSWTKYFKLMVLMSEFISKKSKKKDSYLLLPLFR
jgi:hypothetical protein